MIALQQQRNLVGREAKLAWISDSSSIGVDFLEKLSWNAKVFSQ